MLATILDPNTFCLNNYWLTDKIETPFESPKFLKVKDELVESLFYDNPVLKSVILGFYT